MISFSTLPFVISIHALRMERDISLLAMMLLTASFQSTRSAWSATPLDSLHLQPGVISIHALRMERDNTADKQFTSLEISIHALRMERDDIFKGDSTGEFISIHALRMERDAAASLTTRFG